MTPSSPTRDDDINWDYFGRRFLTHLAQNRLSFREAEQACGISHATLHRATHGKRPDAENFIRMMLFMGLTDVREV